MNVLESFLSLRCDLSVRLWADLVDMFVWKSHIRVRSEHFDGGLGRQLVMRLVRPRHMIDVRRASVINHGL